MSGMFHIDRTGRLFGELIELNLNIIFIKYEEPYGGLGKEEDYKLAFCKTCSTHQQGSSAYGKGLFLVGKGERERGGIKL
jgi:hypothetical protein